MVTLSAKIRAAITAAVAAAAKQGELVQVYVEAEKIRRANIADNVALEDIVEALILQSAMALATIPTPVTRLPLCWVNP